MAVGSVSLPRPSQRVGRGGSHRLLKSGSLITSRNNPGFGSFLPQDYAEVMNLDEKEAEDWDQREDVEFVELGK